MKNPGLDKKVVSERLKTLREREGITQEQLAQVLCTTQQIYSRYETAKADLPLHHLCTLTQYYNVSSDYILGNISHPKAPPELSERFIQHITVRDFICRVSSFSRKSKRRLIDYVNYLSYQEQLVKKDSIVRPVFSWFVSSRIRQTSSALWSVR